MAGGWADAGNAPVVGGVTAPDTATTSDQIQDALKQLPADQKTALFALDKAVPLNTLNSAQIGNLKGLSADELNNLAKLPSSGQEHAGAVARHLQKADPAARPTRLGRHQ